MPDDNKHQFDKITTLIADVICWMTLAMVIVTVLVVVLRYVFSIGSIALQESVVYLHALVISLSAGIAVRKDGHVRIDILYRTFSEKIQALINIAGTLILLIPMCLFMVVFSFEYVLASWQIKESSIEAGGLAVVYVLKSSLIILPLFALLQSLITLKAPIQALKERHK